MGTISQSGANSVGLAADYGHIINGNKIQITGNNSIGIVSANGTLTEKNGEIVIGGTDTAGIYGVNYLDGTTSSSTLGYGNDGIMCTLYFFFFFLFISKAVFPMFFFFF